MRFQPRIPLRKAQERACSVSVITKAEEYRNRQQSRISFQRKSRVAAMTERNLRMMRARVWCSKMSDRALKAVPSLWFSLTRLVTCSDALHEHSASVRNGEKRLEKKPSISILDRPSESVQVDVQPNSEISPNMEAAAIGGKIQGNTPVMSGSSVEESISALEFERSGEVSSGRSENVSAVEDACRQFRNCVIDMVVQEKDFRDLRDVEEILYCYQNLTSPFYRDLLSQFFVEICTDTFGTSASSSSAENEELSCSSAF